MEATRLRRTTVAGICGALLGALAGCMLLIGATRASAQQGEPPGASGIDVTHLPPLLTIRGEPVELRYDVYCGAARDSATEADAACDASGRVFVRAGDRGHFEQLQLHVDPGAAHGRLVADVPPLIAGSRDGFSYYAVFAQGDSNELVVPAGGAAAPQRSLPLERSVDVHLGRHVFGRTRGPDERVVEARWGDREGEVGLEQGRNLPPIGGSSFDVDGTGAVTLLDEAHGRLLRWSAGNHPPSTTPLSINGTIADLAVASDGTTYVLESTGGTPRSNMLRAFRPDGSAIDSGATAERASAVRVGPQGEALVEDDPSAQWLRAAAEGRVLAPAAQRSSGRSGRRLPDGSDVVVLRRGNEIRLALTGANGVRRSWRVTSDDPIAEVQLAEPQGGNLVVVARVYSDEHDEFLVLVLGPKGLVHSFAVDSADWAETAPVSRFRLVGRALYRLGSSPSTVFVDRFDLEVK